MTQTNTLGLPVNQDTNTRQVTGEVKWFDPVKGFGFVVSDGGGPDILLHANVLRNFGQGSVVDGSRITISVLQADRGLQATEVQSITPPDSDDSVPLLELVEYRAADVASLPIAPARVKWFDKAKGFGFANVFGCATVDVFIHIEILRLAGLSDLQSGEAIGLRIIDGEQGRVAVQVLGWETASR